jgi:hypothetical protein
MHRDSRNSKFVYVDVASSVHRETNRQRETDFIQNLLLVSVQII